MQGPRGTEKVQLTQPRWEEEALERVFWRSRFWKLHGDRLRIVSEAQGQFQCEQRNKGKKQPCGHLECCWTVKCGAWVRRKWGCRNWKGCGPREPRVGLFVRVCTPHALTHTMTLAQAAESQLVPALLELFSSLPYIFFITICLLCSKRVDTCLSHSLLHPYCLGQCLEHSRCPINIVHFHYKKDCEQKGCNLRGLLWDVSELLYISCSEQHPALVSTNKGELLILLFICISCSTVL